MSDPYRHDFKEVQGPKALICRREINGEQGGATVEMVMLADGFLIDCGSSGLSQARAHILADIINASGPERLSRKALEEWGNAF